MNPCRFSFNVAHPGLGVKEKLPASAPCFLSRRSCRGAASFNHVLHIAHHVVDRAAQGHIGQVRLALPSADMTGFEDALHSLQGSSGNRVGDFVLMRALKPARQLGLRGGGTDRLCSHS
jgi:hypothetical protein